MSGRMDTGWHFLLIAIGVATIFAAFFWPAPPAQVFAGRWTSPVASAVGGSGVARRLASPGDLTFCPGPMCAVEETARHYCEGELRGVFLAEPDFTCERADGVHRIVCDDIADEHQCGHMGHSDLDYARLQLSEFWRTTNVEDVAAESRTFTKDAGELAPLDALALNCEMFRRFLVCHFKSRTTGEEHPRSPVSCNWMGCTLFGDDSER